MSSDKRWRLVCYDIRDPARWRNVYRIVRGAGTRVQYSIFRCRLDDRETAQLRWELSKVMDSADSLLIVDLCPRCAGNVISRNHVDGWEDPPPTYRVLSGKPNRGRPAPASATPSQSPASDEPTELTPATTDAEQLPGVEQSPAPAANSEMLSVESPLQPEQAPAAVSPKGRGKQS